MIGLDTNVLARYFVHSDDPSSITADTQKQIELAINLLDGDQALMISKTVLLEFEWVICGFYKLPKTHFEQALAYLLSSANIEFEDHLAVESAYSAIDLGFDFADALHHASYRRCDSVATFDNKGFAKRAAKHGLRPQVVLLV